MSADPAISVLETRSVPLSELVPYPGNPLGGRCGLQSPCMATRATIPTREPRPGKKNVGNRRTGAVRGTHSGSRRGTLPAAKDPLIRERVDLVWTLWAQGYTCNQMLPLVNRLMVSRGAPEVEIHTVWEDRKRIMAMLAERDKDRMASHIESFQLVKREAWRAFHAASTSSLNRGSYLNTIAATEERLARLDGTLKAAEASQVTAGVKLEVVFLGADEWNQKLIGAAIESAAPDGPPGGVPALTGPVQAAGGRTPDREDDDGPAGDDGWARGAVG